LAVWKQNKKTHKHREGEKIKVCSVVSSKDLSLFQQDKKSRIAPVSLLLISSLAIALIVNSH